MIIERGDAGEVGGDAKDSVESVSLFSRLCWGIVSGDLGLSTGVQGGRVGLTSVHELVAHELGDDVDVLSRAVVVAHCGPKRRRQRKVLLKNKVGRKIGRLTFVDRLERGFATAIEASSELNLGNAARPKVAKVSAI